MRRSDGGSDALLEAQPSAYIAAIWSGNFLCVPRAAEAVKRLKLKSIS